ncbi:ATP-binding protein [Clostridium novyi]|uniref:ATP-binding protein n=1 Tax=Clostridium novyi TaxID=1542 RepID=UPI000689B875|nr:hypothetical protein [Clostridium novyi]
MLTTLRTIDIKDNNFLKEILEQKCVLNINLESLNKYNIENLICDTLCCNREDVKELVKFINIRTDGNPFFIKTSIESMYLNGVLKFDYSNNKWIWDMNLLKNMKIENNIFEIIIRKINYLPSNTKEILRVASCIGQEFSLEAISGILDISINNVFNNIIPAITEGVIILDEYATKNKVYRFSHSQIQMQIYDCITKEKKEMYHLFIGRYFYNKYSKDKLESKLFEVVNQINKGKNLISEHNEIYNLIKLNLTAGLKNKEAGIHKLALRYFKVSYDLLEENCWNEDYDLTYAVSIELAECEFMNKNFEKAEELFEVILKNVKNSMGNYKNIQYESLHIYIL